MDLKPTLKFTNNLDVLYIDDNKILRESTQLLLGNFFSKVDVAKDGKEGLEIYKQYFQDHQKYYDLIISDIDMPRLNGLEMIKEIYKLNEEQPIIIVTASNDVDHFLEAILNYRSRLRKFRIKFGLIGLVISLIAGAAAIFLGLSAGILGGLYDPFTIGAGGGAAVLCMLFWMIAPMKYFKSAFHRNYLKNIDKLISLGTQSRKDSWQAVRDLAYKYLKKTNGRFPLRDIKQEYKSVHKIFVEGTHEIRKALNELSNLKYNE